MRILLAIGFVLLSCSTVSASEYKIDASHSSVSFKVKHLAISTVFGRFTDFRGNFSYDPSNVKASKTEAVISVKSINTEEKKRDEHLLNEDFFEVEKFPEISFKSKEIKNIKADSFDVLGDLSIRGISKPVTLNVSVGGVVKDPWGKERAGFSATTKINRKDFGLTWSKLMETGGLVVGDDVLITLDIEGVKEG